MAFISAPYSLLAGLLICPFMITYIATWFALTVAIRRKRPKSVPPTAPYAVPILGHALSFGWDTHRFTTAIARRFGTMPVRLRLLVADMYLVSGADNIVSMFGESHNKANMTNNPYRILGVSKMFGTPKSAQDFVAADTSGLHRKPYPGSNIKPENRFDYLVHSSLLKFLTGPDLNPLTDRFTKNLTQGLLGLDIGSEWIVMPDLACFVKLHVFQASVRAMFGHQVLLLNPEFASEFWEFHNGIQNLATGWPRWLRPSAYRARDKCLASVKNWHDWLRRQQTNPTWNDYEVYHPLFGSDLVRKRQEMFSKMDGINADAMASEDLGVMWAANANSVLAAFWSIYDVIRSPLLLCRAREALVHSQAQRTNSAYLPFDGPAFCSTPLIESIYAETLRLRSNVLILRIPDRVDLDIGAWRFPRGQMVAVLGYTAHQDQTVWSAGSKENPHPLNQFWAERFVIYPGDSSSGPLRQGRTQKEWGCGNSEWPVDKPAQSRLTGPLPPVDAPSFSLDGLGGAYIPYGGGHKMCPGRHFAKQEILLTMGILLHHFDIELVHSKPVEMDFTAFGTGVLGPKGRTEFRIRRRHVVA